MGLDEMHEQRKQTDRCVRRWTNVAQRQRSTWKVPLEGVEISLQGEQSQGGKGDGFFWPGNNEQNGCRWSR